MTVERAKLYKCRPPEGLKSPLLVRQVDIEDGIPTEAGVAKAVRGMKGGRAGVPSGMHTEDLKGWLREATCMKSPVRRRWELLVRLLHQMFRDDTSPEELAWATMALNPKGKGEFWGIGIVYVAWKVCTTLVNFKLRQEVILNNALHGFRGGWVTGRSTLEEKLSQQLAGLSPKHLFQVFLDIHKAYDSLYRGRFLEVLLG